MIGLILGVIVAVLLLGVLLHLLKIAVIIALCVGIVMLAQNKFGKKQIK